MRRDVRLYIQDIIDSIQKIMEYSEDIHDLRARITSIRDDLDKP